MFSRFSRFASAHFSGEQLVSTKRKMSAFSLRSQAVIPLIFSALVFLNQSSAHAQTFTEQGDAGQLLGSAQSVGGPFNRIEGSLLPSGDIDLYRVVFDFTGSLTIDAIGLTGNLNMNLHAFNANGNPLGANDDGGGGQNSRLTLAITPGTYFFGVGQNNLEALNSQSSIIQDNDNGILQPQGVLAGWSGPGAGSGTYAITFSSPTAIGSVAGPEPASFALITLGTLAFGGTLRRLRRA